MKKLISVILVLATITALFTYAASAAKLYSTPATADSDITVLSIENRAFSHSNYLWDEEDTLHAESINTSGPALYRFDSKAELDSFIQKHDPASYGYDEVPSAISVLENCDDTFFADYALFLIYLESSGSCRFDITGATYNKVTKTLDITEGYTLNPEEQTTDIVGWFLTLPVLKSEIEGCLRYTVNGIGDGKSTDEVKVININYRGFYHSCFLSDGPDDDIFTESINTLGAPLYRFDSKAELDAFFQKHNPSSSYEGEVSPATDLIWFNNENWALFVIYIEAPSSCRHRITGATYNVITKTMNINTEELCEPDEEHTTDECGYFLTLRVYKPIIEDCLYYTVNGTDDSGDTSPDDDSSEDISEDSSSEETSEDITYDDSEDSSEETSSEEEPDLAYGDVNGDSEINSLDAAQTLKHDAKLIVLEGNALTCGDVNGDGETNSLDAAQILKYDAKLIIAFPVDGETSE